MATAADHASFLPPVLTFLSAAVIGVPIFRLLGRARCSATSWPAS